MRRNANAFTLVELLVVVAIISLLVSLLMPTLSRAKKLARQAVCLSNQRRLGLAFSLYAADYDDVLIGGYSYTTGSASGRRAWYQYFVGPQAFYLDSGEGGDPNGHPNQSNVDDDAGMRCTESSDGGTFAVYTSHHPYAARAGETDGDFMEQYIRTVRPDGVQWGNYTCFRPQQCPRPANFVLMGCSTIGSPLTKGVWLFNVDGPWSFNVHRGTSLWMSHNDRVNGLYVDGHAKSCGTDEMLNAANQPAGRTSGIKRWQLEDGTEVDMR